MRFLQPILFASVAVMLAPTGAMAGVYGGGSMNMVMPASHNYSGRWPVTITHALHGDGTYCLTLTQNGRNAGSASIVMGGQKFPYGTFQIFNQTLVATIQAQGYGQNAGMVFIGSASGSNIGPGVFDEVYGGEAFDEGALAFGMRGGC